MQKNAIYYGSGWKDGFYISTKLRENTKLKKITSISYIYLWSGKKAIIIRLQWRHTSVRFPEYQCCAPARSKRVW